MANWYYYDKNNEKVGPFRTAELKSLVLQGVITQQTVIENDEGRSAQARKVKGLSFPGQQATPNPFEQRNPLPVIDNPFAANPSSSSPFSLPAQSITSPMTSFCTNCGQVVSPVSVACMTCGANPKGHKRFCGHCGVPINEFQVVCVRCGASIAGNSSYASQSGNGFWDFWSLKPNSPLRKRWIYVLIAVCLGGGIGMHNVYAGRSKVAMLQLIIGVLGLFLVFPTFIVWVWAIVDVFSVQEDGLERPFI